MKYLKKFENHSAYEAAESSLILPNVSLCSQEHEVHYNASSPAPSHEYVEIGGIKWATMNIGAESVTDRGLYFQWGDTSGYTASQVGTDKQFSWVDYKYGDGTSNPSAANMSKYNSTDGKTLLDTEDDAVTAAWGGNWRMPTESEWEALSDAVYTDWTSNYNDSGVPGLICTDKTDNSKVLFFPAAGYCSNGTITYQTTLGSYWSKTRHSSDAKVANELFFSSTTTSYNGYNQRSYGFNVRGVLDE
jgi:uncharacterized protein (TIGR02145 family)